MKESDFALIIDFYCIKCFKLGKNTSCRLIRIKKKKEIKKRG